MDKIKSGLRKLKEKFQDHSNSVGQGYFRHMLGSLWSCLLSLGLACQYLIHACFPFVFTDIGCQDQDLNQTQDQNNVNNDNHVEDLQNF